MPRVGRSPRGPETWVIDGTPMRVWGEFSRTSIPITRGAWPDVFFTDGLEPRERMRVHTSRGPAELVGIGPQPPTPPPPTPAPPPAPAPAPVPEVAAPPPAPPASEAAPAAAPRRARVSGAAIVAAAFQKIAALQSDVDRLQEVLVRADVPTSLRAFDDVPPSTTTSLTEVLEGTEPIERVRRSPRFADVPTAAWSMSRVEFTFQLEERIAVLEHWRAKLGHAVEALRLPDREKGTDAADLFGR